MRAARLTALAAVCAFAAAAPARAQLLPPITLPPIPLPPIDTTPIDPVTGTISGTVGGVLGTGGGSTGDPGTGGPGTGGTGTGGSSTGAAGGGGSGSSSDPSAGSGTAGSTVVPGAAAAAPSDNRVPRVGLRILSSLAQIARTGRINVRLSCDEPAAVTLTVVMRVRGKLVRPRAKVIAYGAGPTRRMSVAVPRSAHRGLAASRSVNVSLQAVAVDSARNQGRGSYRQTLHRAREVAHFRHARHRSSSRPVDNRG